MAEKDQAEKEPSIEEILESIRQIISDDGNATAAAPIEDKGAGKLDLSGSQDSVDDVFKDNGSDLDLTPKEQPAVSPEPASDLDLSPSQVDDVFASNLDLSKADEVKVQEVSNLDLSAKEEAPLPVSDIDLSVQKTADKFVSDLDLSGQEQPKSFASDLDLSEKEPKQTFASNLDLSAPAREAVNAVDFSQANKPDDVLDLTSDMAVSVAARAFGAKMDKDTDSLLSEQATGLASAHLARLLATNVALERDDYRRVGKVTLEDMALELMRPLIKEWLDRNMPHIVERVVKREIEKIASITFDR